MGTFQLHVVPGRRTGVRLFTGIVSQTGCTGGSTNVSEPTGCGPGITTDLAYSGGYQLGRNCAEQARKITKYS